MSRLNSSAIAEAGRASNASSARGGKRFDYIERYTRDPLSPFSAVCDMKVETRAICHQLSH